MLLARAAHRECCADRSTRRAAGRHETAPRRSAQHAGGVAAVLFVDSGSVIAAADDRGVLLHRL
jgi:hypothetical protein